VHVLGERDGHNVWNQEQHHGTVSSTEGGHRHNASASVTVAAIVPPTISEVFGAANILVGASTSLSFTVTNPNPSAS